MISISLEDIQNVSDPVKLDDNIDINSNLKIYSVFVSYSHDNENHKNWVENFSKDLIEKARINVILDKWDLNFGNLISKFMEQIKEVDKILIVCSPLYKQKADQQQGGGVDYEKRLIFDEIIKGNSEKIIPIPIRRPKR